MSGGRPQSTTTDLQIRIITDPAPVAPEGERDLVRFMLPTLAAEVDWDGIDEILSETKARLERQCDAELRRVDRQLRELQEKRQNLAALAVSG